METPDGMLSGPLDDGESVESGGITEDVGRTFGALKGSMASMGSVGSARLSSTTTENS